MLIFFIGEVIQTMIFLHYIALHVISTYASANNISLTLKSRT